MEKGGERACYVTPDLGDDYVGGREKKKGEDNKWDGKRKGQTSTTLGVEHSRKKKTSTMHAISHARGILTICNVCSRPPPVVPELCISYITLRYPSVHDISLI